MNPDPFEVISHLEITVPLCKDPDCQDEDCEGEPAPFFLPLTGWDIMIMAKYWGQQ